MFTATQRIIVEEKVRSAGERLSHSQTKPQAHRATNLGKGRNKPSLDFLVATHIQYSSTSIDSLNYTSERSFMGVSLMKLVVFI